MVRWLKRSVLGTPLALATVLLAWPVSAQDLQPLPSPPPSPPAPPAAAPPGVPALPAYVPAAPPLSSPPARGAPIQLDPIRFEPDEPGLSLMMRTGEIPFHRIQRFRYTWYYEHGLAPVYSPICEGPCASQLVPGSYHLALSKDGGNAVPAGVVVLDGPSTIHASYDDHSGERVLGAVILVGGIIGGVVMVIASAAHQACDAHGYCDGGVDGPLLAGGLGVVLGSAILGTILASRWDVAHVTVTSLTLPAAGRLKESPVAGLGGGAAPQGAALTARF